MRTRLVLYSGVLLTCVLGEVYAGAEGLVGAEDR